MGDISKTVWDWLVFSIIIVVLILAAVALIIVFTQFNPCIKNDASEGSGSSSRG